MFMETVVLGAAIIQATMTARNGQICINRPGDVPRTRVNRRLVLASGLAALRGAGRK